MDDKVTHYLELALKSLKYGDTDQAVSNVIWAIWHMEKPKERCLV